LEESGAAILSAVHFVGAVRALEFPVATVACAVASHVGALELALPAACIALLLVRSVHAIGHHVALSGHRKAPVCVAFELIRSARHWLDAEIDMALSHSSIDHVDSADVTTAIDRLDVKQAKKSVELLRELWKVSVHPHPLVLTDSDGVGAVTRQFDGVTD
jgi:hypothetical protein